jgi:hypothetical protein
MFTFYLGPPKEAFTIHIDIIAPHSSMLSRLMDGPFKESIEKSAELPEVAPETFTQFLAYAYSAQPGPVISKPLPLSRLSDSRLIELLLEDGEAEFTCKGCGGHIPLKFSWRFPYCDTCGKNCTELPTWRSSCVKIRCGKGANIARGLLCDDCGSELMPFGWFAMSAREKSAEMQLHVPQHLRELQAFQFDNPLRVRDIWNAF